MIRRDIHPICDNCWEKIVGVERYKIRDLHHFFTYDKNPPCCWCNHPSHGQWWKASRLTVPCTGMFGFHAEQAQIVDIDEMKTKYSDDTEVLTLIQLAKSLQAELSALEKETHNDTTNGNSKTDIPRRRKSVNFR